MHTYNVRDTVEVCIPFSCMVVLAFAVMSAVLIPIYVVYHTDRQPDCRYYTKDGCVSHCGCTWCSNGNMCIEHASRCPNGDVTSAEGCPPDYTEVYIISSIFGVGIVIAAICLVLSCLTLYFGEPYGLNDYTVNI